MPDAPNDYRDRECGGTMQQGGENAAAMELADQAIDRLDMAPNGIRGAVGKEHDVFLGPQAGGEHVPSTDSARRGRQAGQCSYRHRVAGNGVRLPGGSRWFWETASA